MKPFGVRLEKTDKTLLFALFLLCAGVHLFCPSDADARTLKVGAVAGSKAQTLQVPITVDSPLGIAGAAFTIMFDTDSLNVTDVQSTFFDTFANQWTTLSPMPDPIPPDRVEVDGTTYTQPLAYHLETGKGLAISAARCKAEADPSKVALFWVSFSLKSGASTGSYPIRIVSTIVKNTQAGYDPAGEAIPMLIGADESRSLDDPAAFPVLLDPSVAPPVGTIEAGSVAFNPTPDSDGDDYLDDEDAFPDDPNYHLDSDNDGMPDAWENTYGLNPTVNDAATDADNDGFSNLMEFINGTLPNDPNSRPSTPMPWLGLLLDGEPVDSDQDGLSDLLERRVCTDPTDADSDDDGIPDGTEDANLNGIVDEGETNPCDEDTDGDGLQDGTEMSYTLSTVGKGTDKSKFQPDLDPSTGTNPLKADTDQDSYTDGLEDRNKNGRFDVGAGESDPNSSASVPANSGTAWLILLLEE